MLKFVVVVYKRPTLNEEEFIRYFRGVHGPIALKLPGLKKYRQNFVAPDPARKHPGWNAVIELCWDDWQAMEAAWKRPRVWPPLLTCPPSPTLPAPPGP